jgi:hypothetical protein
MVLWAAFAEIGEVSTHSPFFILLSDHHYICALLRVGHFPDETHVEQPLDLNLHCFYLFF